MTYFFGGSNCLEGPRYHEWAGWDDAGNSLAQRWAPTVKYHAGYKWLWLNQGTDGAQVAPGAETVGQAQIVTELAPAFTLAGLFGAADAGAFGGDADGGDAAMDIADTPDGAAAESMDEDG